MKRQRLLIIYTLVFFGALLILLVKGFHKGGLFDPERFNDFRAYHLAAQAVWEGDLVPAYEDQARPFQYPPSFAYLVAPFGWLSYRVRASRAPVNVDIRWAGGPLPVRPNPRQAGVTHLTQLKALEGSESLGERP